MNTTTKVNERINLYQEMIDKLKIDSYTKINDPIEFEKLSTMILIIETDIKLLKLGVIEVQ